MKSLLEEALESDSGFESMNDCEFGEPRPVLDCSLRSSLFSTDSILSLLPSQLSHLRMSCASAHFYSVELACVTARDPVRGLVNGIREVQ